MASKSLISAFTLPYPDDFGQPKEEARVTRQSRMAGTARRGV
jgi:hypothetical protein